MIRRTKIDVDWSIKSNSDDFKRELSRYSKYLREQGLRESTIEGFTWNTSRYLRAVDSASPSLKDAEKFLANLHDWRLARNTINQYQYALRFFHRMHGEDLIVKRLSTNDRIPYYFTADEIARIFDACNILKHLAMLKTIFFACLRVSELCDLDLEDVDLKSLTVRIKHGKGDKEALVPINDECAQTLKKYLDLRPEIEIDERSPIFITDYGKRWNRIGIHRMFVKYKRLAGIEKQGGPHVFARHSSATLMIANGASPLIVKEVLRHSDVRTTLRYCHLTDQITREWYNKTLRIE